MTAGDQMSEEENNKPLIRFDQPHKVSAANELAANESAAEPPPLASFVADFPADSSEQMQVQAVQLARHLQERRREVDHREAHLNARIAQLENELRASRLWLRERSEEFELR